MKFPTTRIGLPAMIIGIVFLLTASAALAMNEELVGAVVKTDQGCVLSTDNGEYLILGKDLTGLEGKTVAVTGNVEDGVKSMTIRVNSVKVLTRKDIIDPSARKAGSKTE
ncbi:MAG: hypothetical protein ACWGNK_09045 [Desulfobacterales bacterium]